MNHSPIAVALAIFHQDEQFLMQLRDNIPEIKYPGHWGLFGGHLEADETPEVGLKREILEELNYQIVNPIKFRAYADAQVIRHVFHAPLEVAIDTLILGEGWDLRLLSLEDLHAGYAYSEKAGGNQPLGKIHQQILLDFLKWQN
ncbi:NUDIX hydrolase [Stanieria cyanosphaera PCC 7437]|uniref:NUDIX hydrolase n=1 Tax=Stanieria cyanosphaera (strain ATCC 29371 / PCC 7437) TaxID=111780 RepID=K9XT40_STAC7|nr:NUDIX hydrolase [Stanieria cyanosphaera]AFZ35246.1 NUDIX hydrolase [Stanieria cyanosphaera PCC 7437]